MDRKSLVIGINSYQHFPNLENCINDAEDLHSFLIGNGFSSTLLVNSMQADLISAIADFKGSITENTISLIFFSGHGVQDERYNYLVASDTEIRQPEDIRYRCIYADELMVTVSKTNLHLVILDACRVNPFSLGRKGSFVGLTKMDAPAGTLIAFSTSPNFASIERTGDRNGIYTKHLINNLQIPNLPVELIFKKTRNNVIADTSERQIPWEESSLFGDDFYFIRHEGETPNTIAFQHLREERSLSVLDLMPFISKANLESASIDHLLLEFSLIKIAAYSEEERHTRTTVDKDHLDHILIDIYYPLLQNRVISENKAKAEFTHEIFDEFELIKNINIGYNTLEIPEESFPQMMINYVKFHDQDGLVGFFLSHYEGEHLLKPFIFLTEQDTVTMKSFALIFGDKVNEILDPFFRLRQSFEKPKSDLSTYFTIEPLPDKEAKKLFDEW